MHHPFELEISDLKAINLNIEEEVSDDQAAQVIGGLVATTLAVGEEGGDIFCPVKPRPVKPPITSDIRRENGGF